jgi:hypothetical protein
VFQEFYRVSLDVKEIKDSGTNIGLFTNYSLRLVLFNTGVTKEIWLICSFSVFEVPGSVRNLLSVGMKNSLQYYK